MKSIVSSQIATVHHEDPKNDKIDDGSEDSEMDVDGEDGGQIVVEAENNAEFDEKYGGGANVAALIVKSARTMPSSRSVIKDSKPMYFQRAKTMISNVMTP